MAQPGVADPEAGPVPLSPQLAPTPAPPPQSCEQRCLGRSHLSFTGVGAGGGGGARHSPVSCSGLSASAAWLPAEGGRGCCGAGKQGNVFWGRPVYLLLQPPSSLGRESPFPSSRRDEPAWWRIPPTTVWSAGGPPRPSGAPACSAAPASPARSTFAFQRHTMRAAEGGWGRRCRYGGRVFSLPPPGPVSGGVGDGAL